MLQNLDADEMTATFLLVLLVQRTVKEVLSEVSVVGGAILHLGTTAGAVDQPRKDAAPAGAGHAVPLLAAGKEAVDKAGDKVGRNGGEST